MRIAMLPGWYPCAAQPAAGIFHRTLARAFAQAGHDVTVLFPELRSLRNWRPGAGGGRLEQRDDGLVHERRWLGFRWWPRERHGVVAFSSAARRLFYDYVRDGGPPDVLHAQAALPAGYAAARLSGVWEIPFVLSEHAGPFSMFMETPWQRWCTRRAFSRAAAATAVSEAERGAIQAEGIRRDISIIPNAIDPAFDEPPAGRADSRGGTRFLCIAALRPGKGVDDLLRAFAIAARARPDVFLTLVGDGPLLGSLHALADSLGVAQRIAWIAAIAHPHGIRDAIGDCDALVLPSRAESFGAVLIEALACGRPVIATRCGGPESIVTPHNGMLVNSGDVDELAAAMDEMTRRCRSYDPPMLAAECRARYGSAVVVQQYVELFERVRAEFARLHPAA